MSDLVQQLRWMLQVMYIDPRNRDVIIGAADEIERLWLVLQTIADEGGNGDFDWDGAECSRYASQALSDTETQEEDDE